MLETKGRVQKKLDAKKNLRNMIMLVSETHPHIFAMV